MFARQTIVTAAPVAATAPFARSAVLTTLVLLAAVATSDAQQAIDAPALSDDWKASRLIEHVEGQGAAEFRRTVEAYHREFRATGNPLLAIESCAFAGHFLAYETGEIVSAASEEFSRCREALRQPPLSGIPEVQVHLVETLWDSEGIAEGRRVLAQAAAWPAPLRSRLHARLAQLHNLNGDETAAGRDAIRAIELDPSSEVVLLAARHFELLGRKDRARQVLLAAPAAPWTDDIIDGAATMLVRLGEPEAATALLRRRSTTGGSAGLFSLAGALAESGDVVGARTTYHEALSEADQEAGASLTDLRSYVEFERVHGSRDDAGAAYAQLRSTYGYAGDPFARLRLSLSVSHPTSAWALSDALGLLALAGALIFFASFPLLGLLPVHYRSLRRLLRGIPLTESRFPWGLGHAWYALAIVFVGGLFASYLFAYTDFENTFSQEPFELALSDNASLAHALLFYVVIALAACVPLLRRVDVASLLEGSWPLRRSLNHATVLVVALRVLVSLANSLASGGPAAIGSSTMRSLQGVHDEYGVAMLFLLAAVAIPVLEEFIFRGVLLNALARHVSFRTAAVIQALAFAAVHEELAAMPLIFMIGLAAAWLARRSGGLAAPIALHAMHNAFACVALVALSR